MSVRFEALETRRMMSASLKGGVLRVSGTGGDDRIKLSLDAGRIVVTTNGVRDGQFLGTAVRKISLNAGNGDDYVSMAARITMSALLDGAAGDDVLVAAAGNDTLVGGAGDDVLRGMAGDDRLQPGNGENLVDGGYDGNDTVDYSSFTTGLWITLSSQRAFSEFDDAHNDTYYSIESADGTQGRDRLWGAPDTKSMRGHGGKDELWAAEAAPTALYGGDGDDTLIDAERASNVLDGGAGDDKVEYDHHREQRFGVEVSLDGIANDGAPNEKDNALNVEDILGTWSSDKVIGNDAKNVITGNGGADTLVGGAGTDTLKGSYGPDSLDGGAGDDLLDGHEGNDTLIGGAGRDELYGGGGNDVFRTRDDRRDYLYGGAGSDRALADLNPGTGILDASDALKEIEIASDRFI